MRLINDLRFGCCCRRGENDDDDGDGDNDASVGIVTAILKNIDKRFDVAPGSALQLATLFEHADWPVNSDDFIATWGKEKLLSILVRTVFLH